MVNFYAGCFVLAAVILPFLETILIPFSLYSGVLGIVWFSFKQVSLESDGFVVNSRGVEERIPFEAVRSVSGGSIFGPPTSHSRSMGLTPVVESAFFRSRVRAMSSGGTQSSGDSFKS